MKKLKAILKKHKKLLIVLVVLLAILVGLIYANKNRNKAETQEDEGTYEAVTKRTIVNSVSGTGSIKAAEDEEVAVQTIGASIKSVNVKVGDRVEAGQVIAVLDSENLKNQKSQLQQTVNDTKSAQAKQEQATQQAQTDAAAGRETQLASLKTQIETTKVALTAAQTDLATAQANYDSVTSQLDADRQEYATALQTETNAAANQAAPATDQTSTDAGQSTTGGTAATQSTRSSGEIMTEILSLQTQQASYYQALAQQQARVATLQTSLTGMENQVTALESSADTDLSGLTGGTGSAVGNTVDGLNDQIKALQEQIDACTVKASISGLVTSVNVEAGDTYNGSTIATIQNDSSYMIEATIDEKDIPDVSAGLSVKFKTDATDDEELDGTVAFVAPSTDGGSSSGSSLSGLSSLAGMDLSSMTGSSATTSQGYVVKINIDSENERLRLGMTASVSIITQEATNVLSVPYEAVQSDEDGGTFVQIKNEAKSRESGETVYKKIPVTVGLQGTYYTEISGDGIEEGLRVYVPKDKGNDSVSDLLNTMGSSGGVQ